MRIGRSPGAGALFLIVAGRRVCVVFWDGIKRACIHVSFEKSPLLFGGVRALCARAETGSVRLRQAVGNSELPPSGPGLSALVDGALALRCAVSGPFAFIGVRRSSESAALRLSDVNVNDSAGVTESKICCQKNDQLGVGQMAHVVAAPAWRGACPVRPISDWSRFRA